MSVGRPQGGATPDVVWIRRCVDCRHDDLHAAFGQRSLIDDRPWHCPACASPDWTPVCLSLPADVAEFSRCPYTDTGS